MLHPSYLLWGMLIGIAVAAPVGPVNVICLQRTLLAGPRQGVTVALGAAVGDAIFGALAPCGFGVHKRRCSRWLPRPL